MTAPLGAFAELALEQEPNYEGGTNAVSTYVSFPPFEELTDNEKPVFLEQKSVASGLQGPLPPAGIAKFEPEFSMGKVHPRPSHLGQLLALFFGSWISVAGDGSTVMDPDGNPVPVGGYLHTFAFKWGDPPQSAQMRAQTGDGKMRFASGIALNQLGVSWENGAMDVEPKGLALVTKSLDAWPGTAPTPVIDTAPPYRRGDLTLSWLTGSAFTRDFDFNFNQAVEALASPIAASEYPTALLYKKDDMPFVAGTIEKATLNDTDWNALANSTQFAAQIKVAHRSVIGSGTYQPALWVNMPGCVLTELTRNAIKAERRREGKYAWQSRLNTSTGALATISLVNETPSYAVYGS